MRINANTHHQPDIRFFQSYKHRGNPFAKFDYMGVLPTENVLQGFLQLCEDMRCNGLRLPESFLKNEKKAYLALQDNQYTTQSYEWENTPTDSWMTTLETWWQDFLKQKEQWEANQ